MLPVKVRDINIQLAPEAIGRAQIVPYEHRTPESASALVVAVLQKGSEHRPRTAPPPAPIIVLEPIKEQLAADQLCYKEQAALVA
ncbi:MAG: hypothetical protein ACR2O6_02685 [Ilumatobacteraceae bacterium]